MAFTAYGLDARIGRLGERDKVKLATLEHSVMMNNKTRYDKSVIGEIIGTPTETDCVKSPVFPSQRN